MTVYNKIEEYKREEKELNSLILEQKINKHRQEFLLSLIESVRRAGGATDWIGMDVTIEELSAILAQNNIRFIYSGLKGVCDD